MLLDVNTTYDEGLYVKTEILQFAQEIRNIFNLTKYSIPSDLEAGVVNLREALFNRSVNEGQIIDMLNKEILTKTYWTRKYRHNVSVKFMKGTIRDYVVVEAGIIDDDNVETAKQTFIFK